MDVVILLSGIFGPYLVIVGLWMFIQKKNCLKICDSIRKTPAAIHIVGWTSLLIGLVIINSFNVWQPNALLFLTLLGWAYLLRALVVLFVPQFYIKMETHEAGLVRLFAFIRIVWGIALCWINISLT